MRFTLLFRLCFVWALLALSTVANAAVDAGYRLVPSSAGGYTLETSAGKRFEYAGYIGFYYAAANGDGSHNLSFSPGKHIIVEKDGSVFSYAGQSVFWQLTRASDGSTTVSLPHPTDGARETLVNSDGSTFSMAGRIAFEGITRNEDGSTDIGYSASGPGGFDGMEVIVEADGRLFSYAGRSSFFMVNRYSDGSTVVNFRHDFRRNIDRYMLIEKNGQPFSYRGLTLFPQQIWRAADGSTTVTTNHGYILVEKDGTLFSYMGVSEFSLLQRQADGSTTFATDPSADPGKVRAQMLLLRDGTLFSYRGQTKFYSIDRWGNGETHIYDPLINLRTTIFPDGTTAVTRPY